MFKAINGWTKAKILKVMRNRRYNAAAVNEEGTCKFLTNNGNRCAVGLFIPKGHEGLRACGGVVDLLSKFEDLVEVMPLKLTALQKLQMSHDDCAGKKKGKEANAKQAMINWVKKHVE